MKKLLTCFFAIMVYAPAVFGADGAISRIIPSDSDRTTAAANKPAGRTNVNTSRVTTSRNLPSTASEMNKSATNVRSTVSRVFSGTSEKPAGNVVSRSGVSSRATLSRTNQDTDALDAAVHTVGRNSRVSAASINSNPAVRRAGVVLRPSTAEVGGRAIIAATGEQTGSNIDESIRKVRGRAATITAESIEETKNRLEQSAALNKTCQDQYNECMDQFCAVIDANQKRCSCSANLKQYAKVEEAVKSANTQLNEIAQRIRYVGLSADEITAIMTETEAEEALSGTTDTSETRSMLDEIEDLIRDPKTTTSSYTSSNSSFGGISLDLDFSGDSADIFSLDFLNNDSASSFSNLRGTDLYNAAKKRCASVLNQCKEIGATSAQITGNYDLAIDKDCIAYEQGLVKMNDTLKSNVRSANMMLQKARLAVLQNKNQYDAKGCISALNTCMTDDMVCGSDYFKCIDPTKRYIDENGEVVLGQKISKITAFMENYNNASINTTFLTDAKDMDINDTDCSPDTTGNGGDGRCVAGYLLQKIGTGQKLTDGGLCRAVLDKCQVFTYDSEGNYNPYNEIVVNYIQRAMVNIRAAQQQIISDYASSCMVDIANCYNQQVSQLNSWSSSNSVDSIHAVMRGACRSVALTCAYAVFDKDEKYNDPAITDDDYIEGVSKMFDNSLLCSEGEIYENGECIDKKNTVNYNYHEMATGYEAQQAPDGNPRIIKSYLTNYQPYDLPLWVDLHGNKLKNLRKECYRYKHSWCYRVSDTKLKCIPFATEETGSTCSSITNASKTFDAVSRTKLYIPSADVNIMISRGDTNVYLSLLEDKGSCIANSFTIFDEKGCRCRGGLAQDSGSALPNTFCTSVTENCPDGYKTIEGKNNCYKDDITMEKVSY
jgi:hypothetical protein